TLVEHQSHPQIFDELSTVRHGGLERLDDPSRHASYRLKDSLAFVFEPDFVVMLCVHGLKMHPWIFSRIPAPIVTCWNISNDDRHASWPLRRRASLRLFHCRFLRMHDTSCRHLGKAARIKPDNQLGDES